MEAPIRKGKRGPIARSPEHNLSEMLGIRVTPSVKHIYKSMADNFGLSETDLFYQLMAIGNFMNDIMTKVGQEERNAIWLAKFKTMMKGFSLISDLEKERQYVRGKNQNTDAKKMAEIENRLIDYLEKKFK
jgi:hypothetical protein